MSEVQRSYSSRSVRLGARLLAASAGASMLMLTACGDDDKFSALYQDADACRADGVFSAEYCNTKFQQAAAEHVQIAPHYERQADCEQDWGDDHCVMDTTPTQNSPSAQTPTQSYAHGTVVYVHGSGGGGSYYPRMTGVWMGYTASEPANGQTAAQRNFYANPVTTARDGTVVSPKTVQAFESFGRTSTAPSESVVIIGSGASRPAPVVSGSSYFSGSGAAISRGGFGSTGMGLGGGE